MLKPYSRGFHNIWENFISIKSWTNPPSEMAMGILAKASILSAQYFGFQSNEYGGLWIGRLWAPHRKSLPHNKSAQLQPEKTEYLELQEAKPKMICFMTCLKMHLY